MLKTTDIAHHFGLSCDTIRRRIRNGELIAQKVRVDYRTTWPAVWACEDGPMPKGKFLGRYKAPLLSKRDLAGVVAYSVRTVERWVQDGLPTRNVFGVVRMNPYDVQTWLVREHGLEVPIEDFLRVPC